MTEMFIYNLTIVKFMRKENIVYTNKNGYSLSYINDYVKHISVETDTIINQSMRGVRQ